MKTKIKNLSWKNIDSYCEDIVNKIKKVNYSPNVIVSVGRGGMIPSRIISDRLNIHTIYMVNIKLYTGINKRMSAPVIMPFNYIVQRQDILLVDDIFDTGITIEAVLNEMRKKQIGSIRTACLLCKENAPSKPTFYSDMVKENEWIVFPWENKEFEGEK